MLAQDIVNAESVIKSVQQEIPDVFGVGHTGGLIIPVKLNHHFSASGLAFQQIIESLNDRFSIQKRFLQTSKKVWLTIIKTGQWPDISDGPFAILPNAVDLNGIAFCYP